MDGKKYAKQLSLAIDQSGITRREIAKDTYMSPSAVGKHALGQRTTDHQTKKSFVARLHNLKLALSSSREDFGTISFMQQPRIHQDVFAADVQASKEQREREAIWDTFNAACTVKHRDRTRKERELVDQGFKEYAEEIGAELTDFIAKAAYAEVDPQHYIDEFNEKLGG